MDNAKTKDQILAEQAAQQAPPVTPHIDVTTIVEDVKHTADEKTLLVEKEKKAIAEGVETEFWQIIKKTLLERVEKLRGAGALRLGNGPLDLQSVGLRAIIVNEIADGFESFIKDVETVHKMKKQQAQDAADKKKEEVNT